MFDVDTELDTPRRFRDGKNDTVAPFKAMLITLIVVPEIANNSRVIGRLFLVRIIVILDDHRTKFTALSRRAFDFFPGLDS